MATILTVHGTFATGEETGDKWWQQGSEFEAHIRELVEAEIRELYWQPVIWDGLNSERSRRAAGLDLARTMLVLEEGRAPYSVIGHSHGGSVTSAALLEYAGRSKGLDHLGCWLTVGTPFIRTRKHRMLFSRLGPLGKSIYAGLLAGSLIALFGYMLEFTGEAFEVAGFGIPVGGLIVGVLIQTIGLLAVPLALLYFFMVYNQRNALPAHKPGVVQFSDQRFAAKWVSLRHLNDEAVQGLRSLRTLDFEIFSRGFATSAIGIAIISIAALAFVVFLLWPSSVRWFFGAVHEPFMRYSWAKYLLLTDGKLR